MFYKRVLRGKLPKLKVEVDTTKGEAAREATIQKGSCRPFSKQFSVGEEVVSMTTGRWDKPAIVIEVRPPGLSYRVQTPDGSVYLRNRKFLKKRIAYPAASRESGELADTAARGILVEPVARQQETAAVPTARRSNRIRQHSNQEVRFTDSHSEKSKFKSNHV